MQSIQARLRGAATLPETLAVSFDTFEAIRVAARSCTDRVPELSAAFITAATAALDDLAVATRSPSRVLATAHNLPPVAQPGQAAPLAQPPAEAGLQRENVSRGQLPAASDHPGPWRRRCVIYS